MKKAIIIFAGLFLLSISAFSQTLAIKELIEKSNCKTYSCFNDFVTTKGFSYSSSPDQKGSKMYIFNSDKNIRLPLMRM